MSRGWPEWFSGTWKPFYGVAARGLAKLRSCVVALPDGRLDCCAVLPLLAVVTDDCKGNVWGAFGKLPPSAVPVEETPPEFNSWGVAQSPRDRLGISASVPSSLETIQQSHR